MNDPSRSCRFKLRNICLIRMMIFLTVAYCHMLRLRAHECEARYVWYASRLTTISRLYNPAETPSYIHQETDEFEGTFFIPCLQQGDGFVYLLFVVESDSKEPTLVCAVDTRYRIWSLPCIPVFMLMYRARLLWEVPPPSLERKISRLNIELRFSFDCQNRWASRFTIQAWIYD